MRILVFKRSELPRWLLPSTGAISLSSFDEILNSLSFSAGEWKEREEVEQDPNYKQIIPYVLVQRSQQFLLYQRQGSEIRLHSLYSIGIGGHVEIGDMGESLLTTLYNCVERELREEINYFEMPQFLGCINDDTNAVGKVHLGFVFLLTLQDHHHITPSNELHNAKWVGWEEVLSFPLETWSKLAFQLAKFHLHSTCN